MPPALADYRGPLPVCSITYRALRQPFVTSITVLNFGVSQVGLFRERLCHGCLERVRIDALEARLSHCREELQKTFDRLQVCPKPLEECYLGHLLYGKT